MLKSKGSLIELPRELIDNFQLQQGNFLLSSLEETLHGVFGKFTASGFTLHGQHQRHTRLQVLEVHILHLKHSTSTHQCVSVHKKVSTFRFVELLLCLRTAPQSEQRLWMPTTIAQPPQHCFTFEGTVALSWASKGLWQALEDAEEVTARQPHRCTHTASVSQLVPVAPMAAWNSQ